MRPRWTSASSCTPDDEGETWAQCDGKIYIWRQDGFGGMFPCDEPSIAPAGDGRLLMFMRTTLGVLYQSWSEDEGETWSMPEPTQLSSSYSPARLRAVPGTGDLVCVWNQVSAREIEAGGRRCRLSSAVSRDGGATWGAVQDDRGRRRRPQRAVGQAAGHALVRP